MAEGLEGIQVLELGGDVAAPLAGKLLADLGATVVKLEPPEGEPGRRRGPFVPGAGGPEASAPYAFLNAGKRSVTIEPGSPSGRATLRALAARAHLLLHNLAPGEMARWGLDPDALCQEFPALVVLSLTPFGLTGPYRDYAAADLNLIHAGGWGWLCPGPGTDPALPPIKPFGQHAWIQAAVHGAIAALGMVHGALRTGVGGHIDLSAQEAVLGIIGRNFMNWSYAGQSDSRLSARAYAPNGFFRCRDAHIYIVCIEEDQWQRLVELMGSPAWAAEARFKDKVIRAQNEAELNAHLSAWAAGWDAADLFKTCQERRICASQVFSSGQLPAQEHLRAREFIREQELPGLGAVPVPGPPYRLQRAWWKQRGAAPRLGEANAAAPRLFAPPARPVAAGTPPGLPLAGIKVLDLGWVWAGPHATLMLAHLGADVVKVESSGRRLDLLRRSGSWAEDLPSGPNRYGAFNQLAQGKRSITVDLSAAAGLDLVRRMAGQGDVVVSNFGTGVMERFGLGADDLRRINPELIVAAISGYGQTGPYRNYMGYGQAAVPLSGISALTGYRPGLPAEVHIAYGDPCAGAYTAFAILAALVARQRNGGGQSIDVSLWETLAASGFEGWMHDVLGLPPLAPMGNRDPYWAPHDCFRCAGEDQWVSIAVTEDAHWSGLCAAIGRPELARAERFADAASRKAHEEEANGIVGAWCRTLEKWEVTRRLQALGVPAFPSLSHPELTADPHLAARGFFSSLPHPEVGRREHPGAPWRCARGGGRARGRAPLLGEHTDDVLRSWLGMDDAEIERLRDGGILK
jgi:crotonobetainyl-CoA:carnitine CoA-transferase CaiB-like acyl-CoA transferase